MADIFDIIADATRRDILRVLLDASGREAPTAGEASVSQIVSTLELSQPTVSKHLKVLREAGLVKVREKGQHRYYHLDPAPLEVVDDWLIPFLGPEEPLGEEPLVPKLAGEAREFASSVGKVIADTSHRVTTVVDKVTGKKRRGE
jgi:ArsR family transcriptional regulator